VVLKDTNITGLFNYLGNLDQTGNTLQTGNRYITGNLTVIGDIDFGDVVVKGNTIATSTSNSNLELKTSGSGEVYAPNNDVQIDNDLVVGGLTSSDSLTSTTSTTSQTYSNSNISIGTNIIETTVSNSDLELRAAGTGRVYIPQDNVKIDNALTVDGTTALKNTVIGTEGGSTLTTGSNNTILGYDAEPTTATVSNQATVGNASVTNFRVPGVGFDIDTARASITGYSKVSEYSATTAPVIKSADFTLADTENWIVNNASVDIVVTLPSGSEYIGRSVTIINWTNHSVSSASSNVYPHNGGSLGTAINAGTDGRFSTIVYDGTSWYVMATNA
jgi:hypothetical protein